MFKEVNALPGAQAELSVFNWYAKANICEHGAEVGRRIILTLHRMRHPGLLLRGDLFHEGFHINLCCVVETFVDRQGG